ncbi:unnamed protein product [Caenorhabditis auriculariae]|uniref:Class II aldolase/adducin N-terminal domain-containing protein n=1 Tax=Caenorhabditis auriculariae TaxID=2777116 RepID=A0A8S1H0D2_9PELO|nr:unnamed protein product [Caenorhabditis auriculariae]
MQPDDFQKHSVANTMSHDLFAELMKQFYELGWMRGSGGAMGCIAGKYLLVSPSALQKERIHESDIFAYDLQDKTCNHGASHSKKFTVSSCAVLFSSIMKKTGSECVIHTHSKAANLITQLVKQDTFEISHQEYIKGVYDPFSGANLRFDDTLVIPIIENRPSESQLLEPIEEVLQNYPRSVAVLVKNHGLFVWGPTWEMAKIMTECIDYLLDLAVDMIRNNLPLVREEASSPEKVDYLETVFEQ